MPLDRPHRRLALLVLPVAAAAAALLVAPAGAATAKRQAQGSHPYVRLLVKLRAHASHHAVSRALAAAGARRVRTLRHLHVVVVRVPRRNAAVLVSRLTRARGVKRVGRDRVVAHLAATSNYVQEVPSDPLWSLQWGAALTQAPTAWAATKGSPNVVVAVLDTGANLSQPDLQGAFVPGYDFVNHDADPSDDNGHGTGTAGIVGARSGNGVGGSGFCPRCSIMPVKVVAADGSATESAVAPGITWAADHGANVINMSFGGTYSATIADAIRYATGKGVLVVAAAGNSGSSSAFYPAADDGVLSVAASQPDDKLYSWSNYGAWVSVAAPGCDLTTLRDGGFGDFCGTSASAPVVSGLAALAMSYSQTSTADAVKQAITSSSHAIGGVGFGRVDVAATLAALGAAFQLLPPPPPPAPVPGATTSSTAPSSDMPRPKSTPTSPHAFAAARMAIRGHTVNRHPHRSLRHAKRSNRRVRHLHVTLSRRRQ
jgi:subtilisin family serine protease